MLFFKIPLCQPKSVGEFQQEKLVFYFSNKVAKACSCGRKISRNIEIKDLFHFKANFYALDTFHTSCGSVFNIGIPSFSNDVTNIFENKGPSGEPVETPSH